MIKSIVIFLLNFADYFHQKKIFKFLKNKGFNGFEIMFDVGAHRGETIKLFKRNFLIDKIYSFEPSPINFKFLKKKENYFKHKYQKSEIILEDIALGEKNKKEKINHFTESSSSSLKKINEDTNYFKRKLKILNISKNVKLVDIFEIDVVKASDYLKKKNIKKINFLKIDTEGYEYEVLLGFDDLISNIEIIMFEHHYDNMIDKKYTFSDINNLLKKNNFKMVYKSKMPFRKTYEYIFFQNNLIKNEI